MPLLKTFISIEQTASATLYKAFLPQITALRDTVHDLLKENKFTDAYKAVHMFSLNGAIDEHRNKLEELLVSSLLFGASQLKPLKQTGLMTGKIKIPAFLPVSIIQLKESLENDMHEMIQDKTLKIIADAEEAHKDQFYKAETMSLADQLNAAVLGTGKALMDISANLTTSRVISYGFLVEAKTTHHTEYQISAELDDRTCPVCEYMDGKTFSVDTELGKIEQVLQTTDPQELKSIAPWPSQSTQGLADLKGLSDDELQTSGYGSPPFHPACRCVLQEVDSSDDTSITPPEPLDENSPIIEPFVEQPAEQTAAETVNNVALTIDDFSSIASFAASPKYKQIDVIGEYTEVLGNIKPADLIEKISRDLNGSKMVVNSIGSNKYNTVYISGKLEEGGESFASLSREFKKAENGTLTVNHDYFALANENQDRGLAKQFLKGSIATYRELGVSKVETHANINVGGYAWAKYGFVPTQETWDKLRRNLLESLTSYAEKATGNKLELIRDATMIAESSNPKGIWAIADMDAAFDGTTFGKRMLFNRDWEGTLDLKDEETMRKFNGYVG